MKTSHLKVLSAIALASFVTQVTSAQDTDQSSGLVCHFDASTYALPDGAAVARFPDRAGKGSLHQWSGESRPRFVLRDGVPALEFDGEDDFLAMTTGLPPVSSMSVIVVAAPASNPGNFRGFLSASDGAINDYIGGFNLDLGPNATDRVEVVNAEGAGFQGALDLFGGSLPPGEFAIFSMTADGKEVMVQVNDNKASVRERKSKPIALDQLFLGARFYSNSEHPPAAGSFFHGRIAEIFVYDRALAPTEIDRLRADLVAKYRIGMPPSEQTIKAARLKVVDSPPEVQMLVPGFDVATLPLKLPNINNVIYRPDGKLIAGAYDGNVYLLSDSDGDGLEDVAKLWWDSKGKTRGPLGIALTPPGFAHGNGVIIPSKGKVSLIIDSDGDDVADTERIIAEGWPEARHAVDAVAVAIDPVDHAIYFGIGTALYNNAYLLDDDGKAHFDVNGEQGTIQRISPDLKSRETICSGVRFSCALRFNEHGDLFATEQEGATWMPNGNPFDELLHIQKGRHFGFPPMHPTHLPGLIDEPSVVDYKPQHQSTCGLNFNVPVNDGGPIFGPELWRNDALVIGESRGKLWRTKLVKRPEGYLAQTQLIACLNKLAIDGCVSPDGGFVICIHSGDPDWGTGPSGEGTIYKIRYVEKELPQPVIAWVQGAGDFRVAFDRPLDPEYLKKLTRDDAVKIEFGEFVSAGDRFEAMRPGYEVVRAQMATQRYHLPVHQVQVSPDRRTLMILAHQQVSQTRYAIQLPGFRDGETIDVGCSTSGVTVRSHSGDVVWMPHPDIKASQQFTVGSAEHDRLWDSLNQQGRLEMRAKLNLEGMLRPVVQPGSEIDFEYPAETVTLTMASPDAAFSVSGLNAESQSSTKGHTAHTLSVDLKSPGNVGFEMNADVQPSGISDFAMRWNTNEDARQRVLPLERILAPWADENATEPLARAVSGISVDVDVTDASLEDGRGKEPSWLRGREIFFSDRAQCSRCHQLNGSGYQVGPDLGNLMHRDVGSVARDIQNPNAAIHPDFVTYQVKMRDGTEHVGTLQTADGTTILGTAGGLGVPLVTGDIASTEPLPVSIMPAGLDKVTGEADFRHLIKYLMNPGLQPAPLEREDAPEPRDLAEVEAVLAAQTARESAPAAPEPLHILLCTGPKDHGPGEHDYPLWRERWAKLLPLAENVSIDVADPWPTSEQFERSDVVVFYSANPGWNLRTARDLVRFQERGGGVVIIHWAVHGGAAPDRFAEHIGLSGIPTMRYRHGPLRLDFTNTTHPISRGFKANHFVDESYWKMVGDPSKIGLLATSEEESVDWPQLWTFERGEGRVFVSIPGHYTWTFDDPLFRVLLLRGICWTAHEPADRLSGLSTIGARVVE